MQGVEPGTPNMGASGGGHQPWGQRTMGSWHRLPCPPGRGCWVPSGGSWPCRWPPRPSPAPGGLSRGHQVRQLVFEPGRKAGCWETSLLSSDKNSSVCLQGEGTGCAAGAWGALAPTGAAGDRTGWPGPAGSAPRTPQPHVSVGTPCRGMVVRGLEGVPWHCPVLPAFTPKSGLEMCEQQLGLSEEGVWGGLHPPTPLPLPLWLISLGLSSGGGGTGMGGGP